MDNWALERLGSAYNSRVTKCAKEAIAVNHKKVTKGLERWRAMSVRAMSKEKDEMLKQLAKFESEKGKSCIAAINIDPKRSAATLSSNEDVHGQTRSNCSMSASSSTRIKRNSSHSEQERLLLNERIPSHHSSSRSVHFCRSSENGHDMQAIHEEALLKNESTHHAWASSASNESPKTSTRGCHNHGTHKLDRMHSTTSSRVMPVISVTGADGRMLEGSTIHHDTSLSPCFSTHSGSEFHKRGSSFFKHDFSRTKPLDMESWKELEELIHDARMYATKKYRDLDIGPSSSNARCKYKRLQHLEGILQKLKPNEREPIVLDPESILACRYLRLSKSNVESLEQMLIDMGKEPQIHVHKDEPIDCVFADYRPATSSTATDKT